jgi:hypothetical protein
MKEALDKLRKGVLCWQLECTGLFAFFSLLFQYWDINIMSQVALGGAYLFFTTLHIMFFILMFFYLKGLEVEECTKKL